MSESSKIEVISASITVKIEAIEESKLNDYTDYIRRVLYSKIAAFMIEKGFSVEVKVEEKDEVKFYLESLNLTNKQEKGDENE